MRAWHFGRPRRRGSMRRLITHKRPERQGKDPRTAGATRHQSREEPRLPRGWKDPRSPLPWSRPTPRVRGGVLDRRAGRDGQPDHARQDAPSQGNRAVALAPIPTRARRRRMALDGLGQPVRTTETDAGSVGVCLLVSRLHRGPVCCVAIRRCHATTRRRRSRRCEPCDHSSRRRSHWRLPGWPRSPA